MPRQRLRGDDGNRTHVQGFAGPCLNHSATSPQHCRGSATATTLQQRPLKVTAISVVCHAERMRRLLPILPLILMVASCSSGGTADTSNAASTTVNGSGSTTPTTPATVEATSTEAPTTAATTTTLDPAAAALALSEPGPYPVGVTTMSLAKGPEVEVWYPAVVGSTGTVTYDIRDFVPPAITALLTADVPATYTFDGERDAALSDGAFPVVLFSHGFTGMRLQSSFLTAHLASWGMIVVSPDHPSRNLFGVLGGTATGDRADSVDDLLQSLNLITAANADTSSPFAGHVDVDHVAAVGHSAGGGTVMDAAADERIDGYVSLASGNLGEATQPDKPSFFMAGTNDQIVSAKDVTLAAFNSATSPSLFWQIDQVGHNGFDDFCTFGNGTGIIGIAEASGLGPVLDGNPQLRTLGQDGCLPPNAPVEQAFPIIRHAVTAWLRGLLGIDANPVQLGPDLQNAYDLPVTIQQK